MALKVLIGGPLATQRKEDITWMWDRPSEELAGVVTSGKRDGEPNGNAFDVDSRGWVRGVVAVRRG